MNPILNFSAPELHVSVASWFVRLWLILRYRKTPTTPVKIASIALLMAITLLMAEMLWRTWGDWSH